MDNKRNNHRINKIFSLRGFIDSKGIFYDAEKYANLVNLASESGIVYRYLGNIKINSAVYENSETTKTKNVSLETYCFLGKRDSLTYVLRKNSK